MHPTARRPKITVSADGTGLISQAGGLLLTQAMRTPNLYLGSGFLRRPLAMRNWWPGSPRCNVTNWRQGHLGERRIIPGGYPVAQRGRYGDDR
jgi:hypothetical protein